MLLNKKFLLTAAASVIANITPASAQTFYQCIPNACSSGYYFNGTGCVKAGVACGANEVEKNGTCYSLNTSGNWTLLYNYTSGQGSATLAAGWYIVSLHGGNSGTNTGRNGSNVVLPGGTVTYMFKVDKSWTFKYGVGQNGQNCSNSYSGEDYKNVYGTGGGGGSWISVNDQYIVAGGAGGFGYNSGAGGAIGAGSSNRINDETNLFSYIGSTCYGGGSGNYKANTTEKRWFAGWYGADNQDMAYEICYYGEGLNSYNAAIWDINGISRAGMLYDVNLYPGYVNLQVGGASGQPGTASHPTNTSAVTGCGTTTGCVKLWKFNYN